MLLFGLISLLPLASPALASSTERTDCPLLQVLPRGKEVLARVDLLTDSASSTSTGLVLGRGSLVWRVPAQVCKDRWTVQVLSIDPLYHDERRGNPPSILSFGCVDPQDLAPVDNLSVSQVRGQDLRLVASSSCTSPAGTLPYSMLESLAPHREVPGMEQVRASYEKLYGSIAPGEPRATDWGFVALPFAHALDTHEIAERDHIESLVNQDEKERGVFQLGPGDTPFYVHSLGGDDPDSDIWGRPELIKAILELAYGWYPYCTSKVAPKAKIPAETAKKACTIQINDLAWYNDKNPDPLGHNSHASGRCVDIRPFRNDGSWYEANWRKKDSRKGVGQRYSRTLTQAFLAYAMSTHGFTNVIFNDRSIRKSLKNVRKLHGHDDHLHLCVPG